jgi:chitin synthase
MFVLVEFEEVITCDHLRRGFANIHESKYFSAFLVHVFTSLVGYHAARMACLMAVQRVAFALPLTLATPVAIILIATACGPNDDGDGTSHGYSLYCLPPADLVGYVAISVVLWLSQTMIMARAAWNSKNSLLALDDALFYRASYVIVLLFRWEFVLVRGAVKEHSNSSS